ILSPYRIHPKLKPSFLTRRSGRLARIAVTALAATAAVAATGLFWGHIWQNAPTIDEIIGGQVGRITDNPGFDTEPAVSADGSHIAYASDRAGGGNLDIWIQPAQGGQPRRLTDHPDDDREPAFSPDGSSIAFRSERRGGGVYMVPAGGGQAR